MKVWICLFCGLVPLYACGDATPSSVAAPEMEPSPCDGGDCPPQITIVSPETGTGFNVSAALVVEASDDQGVALIQAFVDDGLFSETIEARLEETVEAAGLSEGPHTLRAVVTDTAGLKAEASVEVVVDKTPPSISMVQPEDGQLVHDSVECEADATDNLGVVEVKCGVVGHSASATDDAAPWKMTVNLTALAAGEYTLLATAKDVAGGSDQDARTIIIDRPPEVSFIAPDPVGVVRGQTTVEVAVDDDGTLGEVALFVDGQEVGLFDEAGRVSWTPEVGEGTAALRAVATDDRGQEGVAEMEVSFVVDPCDADGDGARSNEEGCDGGDCDDGDAQTNPSVNDQVGDDLDQNCDGVDGVDNDRDSFASVSSGGPDCDDDDEEVYPCPFDPPEVCADRQTDPNNCGACSNRCDIALSCVEALCVCDAPDCEEGSPEEYDFDVPGTYITSLSVSLNPDEGLDLDDDGTPDNAFGPVVEALSLLIGGNINRELQIQIALGTLALGMTWPSLERGAPITDRDGVDVDILSLVDADDNLETRDSWLAERASFMPGYRTARSRFRNGRLEASRVNAGPAEQFFMVLPLGEVTLNVIISEAMLSGRVFTDEDGIRFSSGNLGGLLTLEDLVASVNGYLQSETCECLGLEGPRIDLRAGEGSEACVGSFTASNCSEQGICATLARNCPIFMNLLIPNMDLDTDDDGEFDAFSTYFRLSGQAATIEGLSEDE